MATKSLVIRVEIDHALKAHNCQANARHRLQRGDKRLKVKNGRSWDHYCVPCATNILKRDMARLHALLTQFAIQQQATPPSEEHTGWGPK